MRNWQKRFPPYEGDQPYLYLAFSDADSRKVWSILRILLQRGCRVWYCIGPSGSAEKLRQRQERSANAALTILYLTDSACSDPEAKSHILVNQKLGRPILCLDPDPTDRRLSMGLKEDIPHVPLYPGWDSERIENALIHSESFSQEILDRPVAVKASHLPALLTVLFTVLAVLLAGLAFAGARYFHWFQKPEQEDQVIFSDPVLLSAVRNETGGVPLTEELLSQIRFLHLDAIPENWSELELLPSLERIQVPQQAIAEGGSLPDGDYVIELSGGGKP